MSEQRVWRVAVLAVLVAAGGVCRARADDVSRQFLWEQANAAMAAAARPEEFLAAARTYDRLVRDGALNGPLFFNLGTALLLAGDGAHAEAALLRAERYSGTTPDILANLRLARALRRGQPDAPLPWTRMAFFWHYGVAGRTRVYLAAAAWWLLWLGLLLRRPRLSAGARLRPPHPVAGSLVLLGGFFSLVFGISVAVTCLHEWQDGRTWTEQTLGACRPWSPPLADPGHESRPGSEDMAPEVAT